MEDNVSKPSVVKVKKHNNKWRKVMVLALVLAALLAVGFLAYRKINPTYSESDQCRRQDSSPIYQRAARVMNPDAVNSLAVVVSEIEEMKDYKKDVNCVYIMTIYHLNISDNQKAKEYNELFVALYDPKKGISSDLSDVQVSNEYINERIKFLDEVSEEIMQQPQFSGVGNNAGGDAGE